MNCVFDVSNDCGVKIYYQDTGSIHLNYDDVDKEILKYIKNNIYIYISYLVGENLCQCHVDFPKRKVV